MRVLPILYLLVVRQSAPFVYLKMVTNDQSQTVESLKIETHVTQRNGCLEKDFEHQFENVIISIGCPLNRPYSNLLLTMRAVFICTT